MLVPMAALLAACAAIGLYPPMVVPLLGRAVADWRPGAPLPANLAGQVAPVAALSVMALMLVGLTALGAWLLRNRRSEPAPLVGTWGCGYAFPTARMQYTASSFAEMLTGFFRWGLRPDRHGGEVTGVFPPPAAFHSHTPDTVLDRLLLPLLRLTARSCTWLRARLQHGITGFYLLNVALTLCLLLLAATLLRG
jgi:hydrogenase-4 component B